MTNSTMTYAMTAPELKSCPFCGGEAERINIAHDEHGNDGGSVIQCAECLASSHVEFKYKQNLIDAWNRRRPALEPQPDPRDAVIARLEAYQSRVKPWLDACFGPEIAGDTTERNHRFLEEALELVQSGGCTASEAHQLVDYVFDRPVGEMGQEVGGVMNTLAALCLAYGRDMHEDGETELARVWTKIDKIRAKQAAKPKHSPLPEALAEAKGGDA